MFVLCFGCCIVENLGVCFTHVASVANCRVAGSAENLTLSRACRIEENSLVTATKVAFAEAEKDFADIMFYNTPLHALTKFSPALP